MPSASTVALGNVAPRNNLAELQKIDAGATRHLGVMVRSSVSIREAAAQIVVAGVLMAEIRKADPAAWDRFVQPFQIKVKGKAPAHREIAHVLFRGFTTELQGNGSLPLRTVSRDQICRYGAAISVAHDWFKQGCNEPTKLAQRIVKTGGVWELAKLRAEKREADRLTSTEPKRGEESSPVSLTVDRPLVPILILILPNGSHRPVPQELAQPVIAQVLH